LAHQLVSRIGSGVHSHGKRSLFQSVSIPGNAVHLATLNMIETSGGRADARQAILQDALARNLDPRGVSSPAPCAPFRIWPSLVVPSGSVRSTIVVRVRARENPFIHERVRRGVSGVIPAKIARTGFTKGPWGLDSRGRGKHAVHEQTEADP
jgi:hypothetical protein